MSNDTNPAQHSAAASPAPVRRAEHRESSLTRLIEQQTAKVPSHLFLTASLLSMAASAALEVHGRERTGRFVGSWVAPLLLMGVYNKMVKTFGTY